VFSDVLLEKKIYLHDKPKLNCGLLEGHS
jgi:hypothetical protein